MRKTIILSLLLALCVNSALPAAEIDHKMCSGYLGENMVLIDPNDDTDDEISQSRSDSTEVSISVVVTPKGKKYHYAGCRTVKRI